MALEGTLKDFSLADIFQLIGIQKKTGVLTLKYDGEVVSVSFLNGNVVSADSLKKNLDDRLGNVLVRSGRITQRQLQGALKVQKETLQRLGHVLLADRLINENDLKEALRLQITQIVYRLFRWKDGDYHFSQEESVDYDRQHFSPLSAESILMEGIRMIDEWPVIERKIRSFDMVFRKTRPEARTEIVSRHEHDPVADLATSLSEPDTAESDKGPEALRLGQDEALVYNLIDGRRNVQELIDHARMGDFEACRILYDLLSRNLIAAAGETVAARPVVKQRQRWIGPLLERAGYAVLLAAVVASLATIHRSPFSGSPKLLAPAGALREIDQLVCRNRIERLDEAVQIYYLQKGFYPDDLKELVKGRLVTDLALHDPWGRTFGFISTTEGYRIIAYDAGGVENDTFSIARGQVPVQQPEPRRHGRPGVKIAKP